MTYRNSQTDVPDMIRQLDCDVDVPPPDPEREAALLAAFDEAWERVGRRVEALHYEDTERTTEALRHGKTFRSEATSRVGGWMRYRAWGPIAVPIAIAVAIIWLWIRTGAYLPPDSPMESTAVVEPTLNPGDFVAWPGASALPSFESGELVRMELPTTMLPSIGLYPPATDEGVVTADVLVGQDGLARAVRLVP